MTTHPPRPPLSKLKTLELGTCVVAPSGVRKRADEAWQGPWLARPTLHPVSHIQHQS